MVIELEETRVPGQEEDHETQLFGRERGGVVEEG